MTEEKEKNQRADSLEGQPTEAPADQPEEATLEPQGEVVEIVGEDDVETLRQQLEEEQRKAAEHYDQWLRSVAELRNYKKRMAQEREQLAREANAVLVSHLLPALDDFERAMAVLPNEKLARFSWVEGILLIYRRIQAVLEQHGLRAIEAVGQPFDPYVHDAIIFEEVPADQDQIVLAELQRGYKLHDRVLRPALVKVGKAVLEPAAVEADEVEPAAETEVAPAPTTEGVEAPGPEEETAEAQSGERET